MDSSSTHQNRTLWLVGILHAFTHLYNVALIPLYLPIQADLGLPSVGHATLLVTIMMIAYFAPSYWMGMLADRFRRKRLLTIGLVLNGLGFVGLAFAPNYAVALSSVIVAGFGGSFYHPAATAMIARLFPLRSGRAFGLVGVGAGIGFFLGPLYAGWRGEQAGWRAPVLELGLLGIAAALIFYAWADDEPQAPSPSASPVRAPIFPTRILWLPFLAAALLFSFRDFAGYGMGSLGSLFLQTAHGFSVADTGMALSAMFLAAVISNPLFGGLSDRGRARWISFVLVAAAAIIAIFPRVSTPWFIPLYGAFGFFFMASYPMVEAALMESVPDAVRGRVVGLFITVAGIVGNLAHGWVGAWVKRLGPEAEQPSSYFQVYLILGVMVLAALPGLACLKTLRRNESPLSSGQTRAV